MVNKAVIFGTVAVIALAIILGVTLTVTRKNDDNPKKGEENTKSVSGTISVVANVESDGTTAPPSGVKSVGTTAPPSVVKSVGPTMLVSSNPSVSLSPTAGPTGTIVWNKVGNTMFGGPLKQSFSPVVEITNGGKQVWITGVGSLIMQEFDSNKGEWFVRQDLSDEMTPLVSSLGTTSDGKSIIVGLPMESMAMVFSNDDLDNMTSMWALRGSSIEDDSGKEGDGDKGETIPKLFGHAVDITNEGNMVAVLSGSDATTKILKYQGDEWVLTYIVDSIRDIGSAVALDANGSHLVVGCQYKDEKGAVFVFTISSNKLTLTQRIKGERPTDGFGFDLSLSHDGSVLAVGTNASLNNNQGSANYVNVYKRTMRDDDDYYEQVGDKIRQDATKHFGMSVSLSGAGHRVAVGSMNATPAGSFGITAIFGRGFIYSIQDNSWKLMGDFSFNEPGYENSVQVWLSEDGRRAAFGANGYNDKGETVGSVTVHEATPSN